MAEVKAYISGGHVYCVVHQADRDIAECLRCERLMELDKRSSPPYIVCDVAGGARPLAQDPHFVEWWYSHHRPAR